MFRESIVEEPKATNMSDPKSADWKLRAPRSFGCLWSGLVTSRPSVSITIPKRPPGSAIGRWDVVLARLSAVLDTGNLAASLLALQSLFARAEPVRGGPSC